MGGAPHAVILWTLGALFLLRVAGQVLVAFLGVPWLPPMAEWYSGLLPYPILLPAQVVILLVMGKVSADVSRGHGGAATPRPRLGRPLRALSLLYFLAMAVRYAVTMARHPERRWLGTGTIPIAFHWVLAAWLFTVADFHLRTGRRR